MTGVVSGLCGKINDEIGGAQNTHLSVISGIQSFGRNNVIRSSLFDYPLGTTQATYNPVSTYYADLSFPLSATATDPVFSQCQPLLTGAVNSIGNGCHDLLSPYFYYSMCVDDIARGGSSDLSIIAYTHACSAISNLTYTTPTLTSTFYEYGAGLGPYVPVNISTSFSLFSTDAYGNPQELPSPSFSFPVTMTGSGTYEYSYTATSAGPFNISVKFDNSSVGNTYEIVAYELPTMLTCCGWGDSHITTFNGFTFPLQGFNDYRFLTLGHNQVQIRVAPCNTGTSCITAVAASFEGKTVEVYANGTTPLVYYEGHQQTIPFVNGDVSISSPLPYEILISYPYLYLSLQLYQQCIYLSLGVLTNSTGPFIPPSDGLCGAFNEGLIFGTSAGFPLETDPPVFFLHSYSQSYIVSSSLFTSNNEQDFPSLFVPDYYPSLYNDSFFDPAAVAACSLLNISHELQDACRAFSPSSFFQFCMDDVAATNDTSASQHALVAFVELCNQYTNLPSGYVAIPSHSYAYGPVLSGSIMTGQSTFFLIQGVDALGYNQSFSGDLTVSSSIIGGVNINMFIMVSKGLWRAELEFVANGTFELTILASGIPIFGSPYTVNVYGESIVIPPTPPPQNTSPQLPCFNWGGWHFTLFSGDTLSYKGYGEFVLADLANDQVVVQIRQTPCENSSICVYAVAMKISDTVLSFYAINGAVLALVNTVIVTLPLQVSSSIYVDMSSYLISVIYPNGQINVRMYSGKFDVEVWVNDDGVLALSPLAGLCGNGTLLPTPSQATIQAAENWRVQPTTSLFNYTVTNSSYTQANNLSYVPDYSSHNLSLIDPLFSTSTQVCGQILSLSSSCKSLNSSLFYQACMEDVAEGREIENADSSIVTFSELCTGTNSSTVVPVVALHSYLTGPGLNPTATAGRRTWLLINPLDALGNFPSFSVPFTVTIQSSAASSVYSVPTDLSSTPLPSSYNFSFSLLLPGTYNISVALETGEEVRGSPFSVLARADSTCNCASGQLCIDGTCKGCDGGCNSGVCVQGECVCPGSYTGPTCESTSVPVTVSVNETSPIAIVSPIRISNGSDSSEVSYKISITELREIDTTNAVIRRVILGTLAFDSVPTDSYTRVYNASFALAGNIRTNLFVNFSSTPYARSLSFAGQDLNLVPNSMKFSVQVANWPFISARSRIAIVSQSEITVTSTDKCHGPSTTPEDLNDNIVWVTSVFSGVTLYGRFLVNAIADGRVVTTSNVFNETSSEVSTIVPHFYDYSVIDPDFSVLVDPYAKPDPVLDNAPPGCSLSQKKGGNSTHTAVIVSVVVVVVVAITVAVAYVIYRRRKWNNTRMRIKSAGAAASYSASGKADHGMSPLYTDDKL